MSKNAGVFLLVIAIICLIIGSVFLGKAFNTKNEYLNTDYPSLNVNAYVGGDAYNYIINGTYFTGYAVIGMGCMVIAAIFLVGYCKSLVPPARDSAPKESKRELLPDL